MRTELDWLAENAFAREQGMAEGEARGEARGREAVARALLADKMEPALVARYTGLPEEKVVQLKVE